MAPGEAGDPGLSVPRGVVEEQRPGGDSVTVIQTVRVITLRRDSATLSPVLTKVNNYSATI